MRRARSVKCLGLPLSCAAFMGATAVAPLAHAAGVVTPFNACTFNAAPFVAQSFAGGVPFAGCAGWSAIRGRNGCRKTKGPCPFCVTYPGDHIQMWLPEYFIEVTSAPGESAFTLTADGALLKTHLSLGHAWWKTVSLAPVPLASRALPDVMSQTTLWHARILAMPYANLMGSFSPLPGVEGTEAPTCYAGLSEFLPAQWNYNASDAAYALAWAPLGAGLCNMPGGATLMGGLEAAKGAMSTLSVGKSFEGGAGEVCARPVGAVEGIAKNLRPSSDALAPLTMGPTEISSKLCMGAWGNLLPRTGWSVTADPFLSAMQAAYRFTSLVADVNLNDRWKLRADDKWQIVFPLSAPATCFKPGAPFPFLAPAPFESASQRMSHELAPLSQRKGSYVIAVWRKRDTCEEPLETVGGWSLSHKVHLAKNAAVCTGIHAQGGWL
jgi:hypothetical protein